MDNLDFSQLTDDQLVGLMRAALREAVSRNPAVRAAAQSAVLDEAEKMKISTEAAEREAAAERARERQRVAAEATERVRAEQAASRSTSERQAINDRARAEAAQALQNEERKKQWLRRAACIVNLQPANITLVVYNGHAYVNEGEDRYSRDHLARYDAANKKIETKRHLIGRKAALIGLCTELRATYANVAIIGAEYDWTNEQPAAPEEAKS